jgi:hypothetical protein
MKESLKKKIMEYLSRAEELKEALSKPVKKKAAAASGAGGGGKDGQEYD